MDKTTKLHLYVIDLSQRPTIYQTDNPKYYGKYCIDLQPKTVPTFAPFDSEWLAHHFLIQQFGEVQHKSWFPELYQEPYASCMGCRGYKPERELESVVSITIKYCPTCLKKIQGDLTHHEKDPH